MSDSLLEKYSQNDKILRFDETGEIAGVYRGVIEEDDPFTPGNKRLAYTIEGGDKVHRQLNSTSKRLAKAFYKSEAKNGDQIRIIRIGEGFETNYSVRVLNKPETQQTEVKTTDELPF